jgi:hypothetical protein
VAHSLDKIEDTSTTKPLLLLLLLLFLPEAAADISGEPNNC